MTVRTRFAPSPTGYLHIGGVRTALFNWLFAKGRGGQFLLRIDDTDQQRNVEEALAPILHGLKWLGLDWDEGPEVGGPFGPYYQSQRLERYQAAARKLLATGAAYRDFARPEELDTERKAAQEAGRPFIYSRRWRAETDADAARFEAEGRQGAVRLLMPREGVLVLDDLVRGRVEFPWASEQDHVVQRADGTCLYHLASVVDDHDMQISHIIRAEEHLSNTPRQVFIFQRLGYELPQFAHLPYVAEPGSKLKLSKRKLQKYLKNPEFRRLYDHGVDVAALLDHRLNDFISKRGEPDATSADRAKLAAMFSSRLPVNIPILSDDPNEQREMENLCRSNALEFFQHPKTLEIYTKGTISALTFGIERNPETFNPVISDFYEQVGYLPEAILNYLVLLGWSYDDKKEDFTRNEMLRHFSLERVNKAPASFDPEKLMAFQARAMKRLSVVERTNEIMKFLDRAGWLASSQDVRDLVSKIVAAAGDRIKVAGDIHEYIDFFIDDYYLPIDLAALQERLDQMVERSNQTKSDSEQVVLGFMMKPPTGRELLEAYRAELDSVHPFTVDRLERVMHKFVAQRRVKISDVVHMVRLALTGKTVGFGLYETIAILGRERCLARIDRALALARGPTSTGPSASGAS